MNSTIVCQLQLLQEPYSSNEGRMSAFHAASTVISILETLHSHRQLQYSPTFMYHLSIPLLFYKLTKMNQKLPRRHLLRNPPLSNGSLNPLPPPRNTPKTRRQSRNAGSPLAHMAYCRDDAGIFPDHLYAWAVWSVVGGCCEGV